MSDLWCSLISAIAPNPEAMPAVLQSTIHLLESELVKARAALQEVRPYAALPRIGDEVAVGAMAAYRQNLIGRAPDFYGARRLTLEELGLQPAMHQNTSDIVPEMMAQPASIPPRASLEETLTNSLILDHMAPYLSCPVLNGSVDDLATPSRPDYQNSLHIQTSRSDSLQRRAVARFARRRLFNGRRGILGSLTPYFC
ncbi:uncharacterized protein N7477_001484 [Penicillium maclennaniae]|uniref:uncharacterized protein n=1 Tax=Penicillium maclennaniae TaxID=1343394 RepID=UPI00253FD299|nr:uncharacterized protein N7477_001484 [Penicillium maclennaniae]KAJ5681544.1 hypothetical protein N7477_001484 [Penicillium maclennaniae]